MSRLGWIRLSLMLQIFGQGAAILDIVVSGREMQKLLFGSNDNIEIVSNGNTSKIVDNNNLADFFPPIRPEYTEIQLEFMSRKRLYYEMNLTSSDRSVMSTPTVTIPYRGRLQKQWIVFKIRYPCTKKKSGTVNLGIVLDFFTDSRRKHHYKRVDLSMKRKCKVEKKRNQYTTPKTKCQKRCDLQNFQKKFCLSNFVARVKITKEAEPNAPNPYYLAHVPRKRIFKKPKNVEMVKKNQVIRARGTSITCDCKPLKAHKKYLVFGREDQSNLFLDNYSIAFEINGSDPKIMSLIREFRNSFREINCPRKLQRYFGGNHRRQLV